MTGEDGLSFVGCNAAVSHGPGVPVRFVACDILDAKGATILA